MRPWAALGAVILLAGACSPTYPITSPAAPTPAPTPQPAPAAPPPVASTPPPPRSPVPSAPAANDQCGAAQYQRLVGRPRSEVPVPVDPGRQRVACMTCPVTLDFNPGRLNFFFDAETGIIRKVSCG